MDVYNSIIAHSATHPHVVRSLNFIIEQIRVYTYVLAKSHSFPVLMNQLT